VGTSEKSRSGGRENVDGTKAQVMGGGEGARKTLGALPPVRAEPPLRSQVSGVEGGREKSTVAGVKLNTERQNGLDNAYP